MRCNLILEEKKKKTVKPLNIADAADDVITLNEILY